MEQQMADKSAVPAGSGLRQIMKLYRFLKPYRGRFALGLVFLFLSTAASLMFPRLLGEMVDRANSGGLTAEITRTGLLLLGILVAQSLFAYTRTRLFVVVTEKTLASIRQHLYDHLIRLPMAFFSSRRVGELNSRISSDISLLQDSLTNTLADLLSQLLVITGGITLMMVSSFRLTLFTLTIVPAISLLAFYSGRAIRRYSKKAQAFVAESNTIVEETLQGIQNVKVFTNESFESHRYREKTEQVARAGITGGKYQAAISFIVLGFFVSMAAVIWQGATMIARGQMEAGQLFTFVIYSGFIGGNIAGMAGVYARLQKTIGASENLLQLLDEKTEELDAAPLSDMVHLIRGGITFEGVGFSYPSRDGVVVLKDVSFAVEPGRQVALVGPSGAGKSTIAALLLRLYEPTVGKIMFDGRESSLFPLTTLRSQMAVVMQDVFLFGGTIRENIAYGKPDANEAEIIEAAKQANAWTFIGSFPGKLDTVVGERGVQLSGGQRQRIAIARAVLKNPRILILDEATSSLDSESERQVQEALEKLMEGRTSLVIAHRLSTVRNADHIIVLNDGRIVEQGTHSELISNGSGLYRTLTELQFTH